MNPVARWAAPPRRGSVTRLGHSTLLIEIDGVRILTDPVWSTRVSPLAFGPKRFHPVPAPLAALRRSTSCSSRTTTTITRPADDPRPGPCRRPVRHVVRRGAIIESGGPARDRDRARLVERTEVNGVTITATPRSTSPVAESGPEQHALVGDALPGDRHSFFFGADSGLTPEFKGSAVAWDRSTWSPSRSGPTIRRGRHPPGPEHALVARGMLGSGRSSPSTGDVQPRHPPVGRAGGAIVRSRPDAQVQLLLPGSARRSNRRAEGIVPWWRGIAAGRAPGNDDEGLARRALEWLPD
ncbi:MAG: hypothetical protein IPN47_12805 [Gemmatimonadetes bacterium]|nr:hypothetical protein [Gemmatimonadota bacterium]